MNHPSHSTDRPNWVRRAAVVVWLAWSASYAVTAYQLFARVTHPHFLPLTLLMFLGCAAGILAVASGIWRMIRGPGRLVAIGWLSFATIPILLWAAHATYGLSTVRTTSRSVGYPLKLAGVGAAAVADGLTRLVYPNRVAGKHIRMIYDDCADPEADVAAMDHHIEQVGKVLGRPVPTTVHWVRGGLMGLRGLSLVGTAICGDADPVEERTGRLGYVDRHETAHNVLNDQLPPTACPPTVFIEGWAESQSRESPVARAQQLWDMRRREKALSLRQLLSPEWYANGDNLVYFQGGMLVDFLVRRYGGDKFFRLCATCRPETVADDCNKIYGADVDQLDELFWADIRDRALGNAATRRQNISPELGLSLDGPNDESAREEFLQRYPKEVEKLKEAYRHVQISAKHEHPAGTADRSEDMEFELIRDGERVRLRRAWSESAVIYVATPQRSFLLAKSPSESRFRTVWVTPSASYTGTLEQIRNTSPELGVPYEFVEANLLERMKLPGIAVTRAVRVQEGSRRLIKIYFEYEAPSDDEPYLEAGWLSFRADQCWALDAYEIHVKNVPPEVRRAIPKSQQSELPAFGIEQGTVRYRGEQNGVPVLESVERKRFIPGGKPQRQYEWTVRVTEIQFGPSPDKTFDLASFDAAPPMERGNGAAAPGEDVFVRLTRWLVRAIWLCSAAVVISFLPPLVRRAVTGKGEKCRRDQY